MWSVTFAAGIRLVGVHKETKMAAVNQYNLDVAIDWLLSYSGANTNIYEQRQDKLSAVLFNAYDWLLICWYICAIEPCCIYSLTIQKLQVFSHMELFESQRTLEVMAAPW